MKQKKTSTKEKLGQTILFLLLGVVSIILILALWDFLYAANYEGRSNYTGRKILFTACIIPIGFLCGAVVPWIKFNGIKKEIVEGQLMSLDNEGCYLGPLNALTLEEVKRLAHIFDHEADYRNERFRYNCYAIYLKTTKDGYWFFPDKTDKSLIMTGEPGSIGDAGLGMGLKSAKKRVGF